jgi:hypothetical protein
LEESKFLTLRAYTHGIKATHERAAQPLERTKDNMGKYYDHHYQPQPKYQEGVEVLQNIKNI